MGEISNKLQEYITAVEKNEKEVSDAAKNLIVLCADSFVLGGNWGLLPFEETKTLFSTRPTQDEERFIQCTKVSNGYIVEVDRNYLKWIINAFVEGAVGNKYDAVAEVRKGEEDKKFDRFLNRIFNGTDCHIIEGSKYNMVCIGLYSVNEVQLVQVSGIEYPAYRLTIDEFLDKLYIKAVEENKVVGIKVDDGNGNVSFAGINALYDSNGNVNVALKKDIINGLTIGETKRAAFIELKIQK